jgi:hypothetical protein
MRSALLDQKSESYDEDGFSSLRRFLISVTAFSRSFRSSQRGVVDKAADGFLLLLDRTGMAGMAGVV